jgi:hypothetical protein
MIQIVIWRNTPHRPVRQSLKLALSCNDKCCGLRIAQAHVIEGTN